VVSIRFSTLLAQRLCLEQCGIKKQAATLHLCLFTLPQPCLCSTSAPLCCHHPCMTHLPHPPHVSTEPLYLAVAVCSGICLSITLVPIPVPSAMPQCDNLCPPIAAPSMSLLCQWWPSIVVLLVFCYPQLLFVVLMACCALCCHAC